MDGPKPDTRWKAGRIATALYYAPYVPPHTTGICHPPVKLSHEKSSRVDGMGSCQGVLSTFHCGSLFVLYVHTKSAKNGETPQTRYNRACQTGPFHFCGDFNAILGVTNGKLLSQSKMQIR